MPGTTRRCRVPGCGPLSESSQSQAAWLYQVCDFHQAAETVELDGELWRFCRPCLVFHSLNWFVGGEHVCTRYTGRPANCPDAHSGDDTSLDVSNRRRGGSNPQSRMDQTEAELGRGLVDHMAVRTPPSKLVIPAFYSAAVWAMGYHQPLTWLALGTAAAGLHLLLPYLYTTHYLKPLNTLRKLAAKRRMSVSPALELLTSNPRQLRLFEEVAAKQSSFGWFCDSLMFVALLAVSSFRFCVILMGGTCSLWVAPPLVVGLLVLVPLRARAIAGGQHYRRQWIDLVADLISRAANVGSTLVDTRPPPVIFQGVGGLALHGLLLGVEGVVLLAKIFVLEKPLRWSIPMEAAFGAVLSVWLFPTCARRHVAAGYLPDSSTGLLPYSAGGILLLSSIVYVAWRAKSEAGYLEAFLTRESSKDWGTVLRPRLIMSTKLFGATPDALPWDLREQILRLPEEEAESLEGYIRPGCVLLTVSYRFESGDRLESARSALLANLRLTSGASALPWAQTDAVVTVGDTRFTVEGGEVVNEEAVLAPEIIAVDRVAVCGGETATLRAMGLGSAPFSVMLRSRKGYTELEAVSKDEIDSDTKVVTVRLPEAPEPGMAWLEVQSHASSRCPIISDGFPLLFTWKEQLAEELSSCLLDRLPTVQHVASFLEDVAEHLCEGVLCRGHDNDPAVPPAVLLEVLRLGLLECFDMLVRKVETLEAADRATRGLLSEAILSGSEDLLRMVIDLLKWYSLPVEPCCIPADSLDGYSPLHLAAQQGNTPMVALLLDNIPDPELRWHTLQSTVDGATPHELMKVNQPGFSSKAAIRSLKSWQAQAVWGTDLIASLSFQTTPSKVLFPAAYSTVLWATGWSEPQALVALALVGLGLHVLCPRFHKMYVRRLQRVREVAEICKVQVSPGLRILAPEVQSAYEESELQRSPRAPLVDSLLLAIMVLPAALFPSFESWRLPSNRGSMEAWTVAQAVLVVSGLTVLRTWAVKAGRLGVRQWVDLVAWNYCMTGLFGHRIYLWAIGSKGCTMPVPSSQITALLSVWMRAPVAFSMKALFVSGPVSKGAFVLEPLYGSASALLCLSTVSTWCLKAMGGNQAEVPAFFGFAGAAIILVGNLCYVAARVHAEAGRICAFLDSLHRSAASNKARPSASR